MSERHTPPEQQGELIPRRTQEETLARIEAVTDRLEWLAQELEHFLNSPGTPTEPR